MSLDKKPPDAIGLAENIMMLLDHGAFTATYKYAVLLALMDLCLEHTSRSGLAPSIITTYQLAEKVIEIYWPHTTPFRRQKKGVLIQNIGRRHSQAAIVREIEKFRDSVKNGGLKRLSEAKRLDRERYLRLVRNVEWKLIEMPLPRLQIIGSQNFPFLYTINWDKDISLKDVRAYQHGKESDFDNRIQLQNGVADNLIRLNNLLRPLIHRQWTVKISQINDLFEADLEAFLFGATRVGMDRIRPYLEDYQNNRCFYCEDPIRRSDKFKPEVDHFIPWSRYPDNGLANLVVAHRHCNNYKRDFLAATAHVRKWIRRVDRQCNESQQFDDLAILSQWEMRDVETIGVGAAIYLNLANDTELWLRPSEFVRADRNVLRKAFTGIQ